MGFIFNYVVRRRHFSWWTKYNCKPSCIDESYREANAHLDVLSAGLDCGVAISIIVIFFCVQYPLAGSIGRNTIQTWWGNTVPFDNADGRSVSYKALPESGHFG